MYWDKGRLPGATLHKYGGEVVIACYLESISGWVDLIQFPCDLSKTHNINTLEVQGVSGTKV